MILTKAEAIQTGADGVNTVWIPICDWVGQTLRQTVGQTVYHTLLEPDGGWSQSTEEVDGRMFRNSEIHPTIRQFKVLSAILSRNTLKRWEHRG